MSQKNKITEEILKELGIQPTDTNIKKYKKVWWQSSRTKAKGGLWLTPQGFEAFEKAQIKNYKIKFPEPINILENKFIIWLDNAMEHPFFITKREIYVFGERTAVQMMLFSGDLKLWHNAHIKNKLKNS